MTEDLTTFASLRQAIREELENYNGDWTKPGFRALAVYRFGGWAKARRRSSTLQKMTARLLDVLYIVGHRFVRNHYGIELHRSADVGRGVKFPHQGGIVIHHYATIGDNCVIQHGVTLGSAGRGVTKDQAPILEPDVMVGPGAVILGKVTVGRGARIGANVVIYTDVPAGATVVANSPRMIYAPNVKKAAETSKKASEVGGGE